MLNLAAGAVEELSKDNPSGEIVEYKTKDFVKTVEVRPPSNQLLGRRGHVERVWVLGLSMSFLFFRNNVFIACKDACYS